MLAMGGWQTVAPPPVLLPILLAPASIVGRYDPYRPLGPSTTASLD